MERNSCLTKKHLSPEFLTDVVSVTCTGEAPLRQYTKDFWSRAQTVTDPQSGFPATVFGR